MQNSLQYDAILVIQHDSLVEFLSRTLAEFVCLFMFLYHHPQHSIRVLCVHPGQAIAPAWNSENSTRLVSLLEFPIQ